MLSFEQYLKYSAQEIMDKKIQAQPKHDLKGSLRSDVVLDGTGPAQTISTLPRTYCYLPEAFSEDHITFYEGGQFFLDTQQLSWIMNDLFEDNAPSKHLPRLEKLLKVIFPNLQFDLLNLSKSWSELESVGQSNSSEPTRTIKRCREERDILYQCIVPPNGLKVRTKKQKIAGVCTLIANLVIGGGITFSGGIAIGTVAELEQTVPQPQYTHCNRWWRRLLFSFRSTAIEISCDA